MNVLPILNKMFCCILNSKKEYFPTEKMNGIVTPSIIIFLTIAISTKQNFGNPINCITPAEFPSDWKQYVENYCFLGRVFYISRNETLPLNETVRDRQSFDYYGWMPILLVIQTIFFCAPLLIWNSLTKTSLFNTNINSLNANQLDWLAQNFFEKMSSVNHLFYLATVFLSVKLCNIVIILALLYVPHS